MKNMDIRKAANEARVYLWEIAEVYGLGDSNFSRKLRRELSKEEKEKILVIIEQIKERKKNMME